MTRFTNAPLIGLLLLLGCTGRCTGTVPGQPGAIRLAVELRDGSITVGRSNLKLFNLRSASIGPVRAPVRMIQRIEFDDDHEMARIIFRNGEILHGAFDLPAFPLETSLGKVSIRAERIVRVIDWYTARLVACYPFNGDADDESGSTNHGIVHGAHLIQDRFGNPESAYELDGRDDYIDVSAVCDDISLLENTVSLWFRQALSPHDRRSEQTLYAQWHRHFIRCQNETLAAYASTSENWNDYTNLPKGAEYWLGGTALQPGQWHHVVLVFESGKTSALYLDGQKVAEMAETSGLGLAFFRGTFSLGRMLDSVEPEEHPNGRNFHGSLDDVRIYNRALSESEVEELYSMEKQAEESPGEGLGDRSICRRPKGTS